MRKLRFITRRRLKWVAAIAAGLFAALFISTLWISPGFITGTQNHLLYLHADRGRIEGGIALEAPWYNAGQRTSGTIEKHSPIGFDLWFLIERRPYSNGTATTTVYSLFVPLWLPFVVCALGAMYLWRTDHPPPWQCAACRYDLRGIETDLCPECGKQFESAS